MGMYRTTVFCSLLVLLGCGNSDQLTLCPVSGIVMFDSKPLKDASVVFMPEEGVVAMGQTDDSGCFSLNTRGAAGAQAGVYKISITSTQQVGDTTKIPEEMTPAERASLYRSLIPEKYSNPLTSDFSATVVRGGDNNFTFELVK